MSAPTSKRHAQHTPTPPSPFLSISELVLPWLTPQELASISCTCHTLSHLSKLITTVRSSDASRLFEPLPIPFINTVDSHSYTFFLYTPTYLTSSPNFSRQFWGGRINPNPNCNTHFNFDSFLGVSDSVGCDCGEICDEDCSCAVLWGGEMRTECGTSCDCELNCGNRVTQMGVSVELKIVRVEKKGWGLFAAQFIPEGKFVCEYAGELLTTKEAKRRQQVYDELAKGGCFSSALLVVREFLPSRKACFRINIDATRIGNVARFINHSCDGGNLSAILIRSSGALLPRVCFFASRDIQAGEELSFSYGDVRLRPEGLHCFCGSSCCFGILPSEDT
ncbi:histone-lysine N-methyltransferase SUVR3-like [Chenopodium quinoa]|uniref:Histone-lysine N-methyltransferase SUVR3 n=1 Tax=Chenopodium quinoa TaxID=63459 RepID=A0A803N0F6_CHEQI|nr:histone-lysine N-methyltransferase SUVR3-like [Chenopodium quinoa]